jgi:hypothetical protein
MVSFRAVMTPCSLSLRVALPLATVALVLVRCSSSSSPAVGKGPADAAGDAGHTHHGNDAGSDATQDVAPGRDVRPDAIIDPHDCVAVTAGSSANGIGAYCSPGAGQCLHAGPGGMATLCSADLSAPAHEWFCTITCSTTSDCGPGGGTCLMTPFSQICVPATCTGALGDASLGPIDASDGAVTPDGSSPLDGSQDGAEHDAETHDGANAGDARGDAHHDAGDAQ